MMLYQLSTVKVINKSDGTHRYSPLCEIKNICVNEVVDILNTSRRYENNDILIETK